MASTSRNSIHAHELDSVSWGSYQPKTSISWGGLGDPNINIIAFSQDANQPIVSGALKFVGPEEASEEIHPYIIVNRKIDFRELVHHIVFKWDLARPEAILDIISSKETISSGSLSSESHAADFQIGIVNAAGRANMWVLTEGLLGSPNDVIGEAVAEYNAAYKNEHDANPYFAEYKSDIVLIGLAPSDSVSYASWLTSSAIYDSESVVEIDNDNYDKKLEPNHTHYLIMQTESSEASADYKAEDVMFSLRTKLITSVSGNLLRGRKLSMAFETFQPCVGLLIDGGPMEIDRVHWMLANQRPVIVIKSKALLASQLIADAFSERSRFSDKLYMDKILKRKLLGNVLQAFSEEFKMDDLAHLQYRDKILNCVKYAFQGDSQFLTIVDPLGKGHDLKDLSKFILTAIVLAQSNSTRIKNINYNLQLALNWNCPDVASKLILKKNYEFQIHSNLFFTALVTPNREQFVNLFLKFGFCLSTFMSRTRENDLLDALLKSEFFLQNCMRPVIGYVFEFTPQQFLYGRKSQYNRIVTHISGLNGLIHFSEGLNLKKKLSSAEKTILERNARMELICWAVLTNKPALVRKLWQRTIEPIAVGLVISNMFYRLSKLTIQDIDLKNQVYKTSVQFSRLAIEVLNKIDNDSTLVALKTLTTPKKHFNGHTIIELAFIGENKFFIAHPCVQSALRESWEGSIKLQSIRLGVGFTMPASIKILSSLIFVFPIYFWVDINKPTHQENDSENDYFSMNENGRHSDEESSSTLQGSSSKKNIHILKKHYMLLAAPVAKFLLFLLVEFVHMCIFTVWILMPFCGHFYLSITLAAWNVLKLIQKVHIIIVWKIKFPSNTLLWSYWDALVNIYVLAVFGLSIYRRLFWLPITYMDIKVMQAFGMLWYFYHALFYLLPVSPVLGPMLVNITLMIRRDVINWLLLWSMCFISGGLAIYATVHPLHKLNFQFLSRAITSGFTSLFLNPTPQENEELKDCEQKYEEFPNTCNFEEVNYTLAPHIGECQFHSKAADLLVIQLMAMTRLVFYTLLFSMLYVTINKTKQRSIEIWKYQFYHHLCDFSLRPILPAPLSIFLYLWYCIKFVIYCSKSPCCTKNIKDERQDHIAQTIRLEVPYNQLKSYVQAVEKEEDEQKSSISSTLSLIEERFNTQYKMINRLNVRLIDAEQNQTQINLILESIVQKLEGLAHRKDAKKAQILNVGHTESRKSPYPGTDIQRSPVFEKDIPWTIKFEAYDPNFYSRPIDQYPKHLRPWVDRDILVRRASIGSIFDKKASEEEVLQIPHPIYNIEQSFFLPNGEPVTINRISFVPQSDQEKGYSLDFLGLPVNPMGRTGLRGRGSLFRYGPNHSIQAIISRWKHMKKTAEDKKPSENILEILVIQDQTNPNILNFPMVELNQSTEPYRALCKYFDAEIILEVTGQEYYNFDNEDMAHYFSQFSSTDKKRKKKSHYVSHGFSSTAIFRGYVDSALNTDNAWQETEIWNFHYKYKEGFDLRLSKNTYATWIEASASAQLSAVQKAALVEVCKLQKVKVKYT